MPVRSRRATGHSPGRPAKMGDDYRLRRLELRKAPDMPKAPNRGPYPTTSHRSFKIRTCFAGAVPDPEQKVNVRGHTNRSHG